MGCEVFDVVLLAFLVLFCLFICLPLYTIWPVSPIISMLS